MFTLIFLWSLVKVWLPFAVPVLATYGGMQFIAYAKTGSFIKPLDRV